MLLIFDNYDSHIQIDLINTARENDVIMLMLPPDCRHELLSLDGSVYGTFKNYFNAAVYRLMLRQPGKPIQIYNIPELCKEAFEDIFTTPNIICGLSFDIVSSSHSNSRLIQAIKSFPIILKEVSLWSEIMLQLHEQKIQYKKSPM